MSAIEWIFSNLSTLVVCLIMVFLVVLAVRHMVKNKKAGKSPCGCGGCGCGGGMSCSSCFTRSICNSRGDEQPVEMPDKTEKMK